MTSASRTFHCCGCVCAVDVDGDGPMGSAAEAADAAERLLRAWEERFSRFLPTSELSALNADPRSVVPVTPLMRRLVSAIIEAAHRTGGLVDATVVPELERAGYRLSFAGAGLGLREALDRAPARRPALGDPLRRYARVSIDHLTGGVRRPPGVQLDSGGLGKGLFADELGRLLEGHERFAVDCGGDLRIGGTRHEPRAIRVESPFDGTLLHAFDRASGGVATSGIGRRSWPDAGGAPTHHLLDPATGRPAFTGLVQVTALAPTALQAEVLAKAALLAGPAEMRRWLQHGGLAVFDDGHHEVVAPRRRAPAVRVRRRAGALHLQPAGVP